jgi:hypothetical protein
MTTTTSDMRAFDSYSFHARVIPIALLVLPAVVLLAAGLISGSRLGAVSGFVVTVLAAIAGQLGRDRGRALQPKLWDGWGGNPALQRLRHRSAVRTEQLERQHRRVEAVLAEPLPSAQDEQNDPDAADAQYDEAVRRLIALTRDRSRFGLLFAENVNYGQRRNMLGLRWIGLAVALATLVCSATLLIIAGGTLADRAERYVPGAAIALLLLPFWLRVVSPHWVRVPAEAYADRLMESVEILVPNGSVGLAG